MRPPVLAALIALSALALPACIGTPLPGGSPRPIEIERGVPYAERPGGPLRADLYRPRAGGPRPAVVVVHPGGWVMGSRRDVAGLARRLAEHGYVAAAIDYRLAPSHRFPAPVEDCRDAVRWLRTRATELGVDPERIAIFGYSAGAHLAALVATASPADAASRVQAAVLGGTPADLRRLRGVEPVRLLLGATHRERPDLYAAASPIRHVSGDDPPVFLYHGRSDWLIAPEHTRRLAEALHGAGVPVELRLSDGGHFANLLFAREEVEDAIAFLDRWLGAPGPLATAAVRPLRNPSLESSIR